MRRREREIFLILFLLVLAVGSAWYMRRGRSSSSPEPSPAGYSPHPRFQPEITPLLGHFRSGAVEDYAGVLCVEPGPRQRKCFLKAIDGARFEPLWHIGPFEGPASIGIRSLLVGDRVIVADGAGWVGVHKASTGELVAENETGGASSELCGAPDPGTLVWLGKSEDSGLFVDASTGRATPGERPDWCPALPEGLAWRPQARVVPAELAAPALAGEKDFALHLALERGGIHVAVGHRLDQWRNKVATVIRFDPQARTVLWRRPLGMAVGSDFALGATDMTQRILVLFRVHTPSAMFSIVDLATGEVRCTGHVGASFSLLSPTMALSDERVAFYQGSTYEKQIQLILRSTTTCQDLPRP